MVEEQKEDLPLTAEHDVDRRRTSPPPKFSKLAQLRVMVNSRCGRACFFCRPSGEAVPTKPGQELDLKTVEVVARAYVELGGAFVKLTGGDPALWSQLVPCVAALKNGAGVQQLHVISRHPRIGSLAGPLRAAGADLINISLDTLNSELHKEITGIDDLSAVLEAIEQCVATGLPVKINTVVMAGVNDGEIANIVAFCEHIGVASLKLLDTIRDLDVGLESFVWRLRRLRNVGLRDLYRPLGPIVAALKERAVKTRSLMQGGLGHPMLGITLPSGLEVVVKDHRAGAWYGSICDGCRHYPCHDALMALRLTADARLQFCLLRHDMTVDLRPHLADGLPAVIAALSKALEVYDKATFYPNIRRLNNALPSSHSLLSED